MAREFLSLVLLVTGCTDTDTPPIEDAGGCDGKVEIIPDEPALHVAMGTPVEWSSNPPATGMHYGVWAAWDRSYQNLDRGYYVHNAEHGGIVLLYNCPNGCQETVDRLIDTARTMDPDSACEAPLRNRVIVTSDPLLPPGIEVAAVAWDVVYTATCYDPFVKTFAHAHYNRAPEDLCADGIGAGGTFIDP